jgi:hypothetical protein
MGIVQSLHLPATSEQAHLSSHWLNAQLLASIALRARRWHMLSDASLTLKDCTGYCRQCLASIAKPFA